jgi:hypothetical protein
VTRAARTVDGLLAQLPSDDPERGALEARASKYGRACGCSSGALFLLSSVLLVAAYFAAGGGVGMSSAAAALVFVVVATLVGKLAGLSLAALRLSLLGRSIGRRLRQQRRLERVHVH